MTDFVANTDIVKEPAVNESTTPPAITYSANGDTWTIPSGITIASTNNAGIFSDFSNNELTNRGTISSGNNIAVVFRNGDHGVVSNGVDAWIVGLQTGVWFGGTLGTTSDTLNNDGSVVGLRFYGVLFVFGGGGVFNNRGDAYGDEAGVHASSSAPVTIHNDGSIRSARSGVYASQSANVVVTIDNGAEGTIKAPTAIRSDGLGSVDIDNLGTIIGSILLTTPQADRVHNEGTITGEIRLGPGGDTFVFAGGRQGTVLGESGADHFEFANKLAPKKDAGFIGDFTTGEDLIGVSRKLFKKIGHEGPLKAKFFNVGNKASDKNDHFIYSDKKDALFYDKDGKGGDGQVLVVKLPDGADLKAGDLLVIA